jgi:hypothetical protein
MGVAAPRSSSLEGDTASPSGRPRTEGQSSNPLPYFKIAAGLKQGLREGLHVVSIPTTVSFLGWVRSREQEWVIFAGRLGVHRHSL